MVWVLVVNLCFRTIVTGHGVASTCTVIMFPTRPALDDAMQLHSLLLRCSAPAEFAGRHRTAEVPAAHVHTVERSRRAGSAA